MLTMKKVGLIIGITKKDETYLEGRGEHDYFALLLNMIS